MWTAPVQVCEGEDIETLKSAFVELSARYPDHSAFNVAAEVFRGKPDPARALIAAAQWSNSIEILEQVRLARINLKNRTNGGKTDKEVRLEELREIATATGTLDRDRIAAYKLMAEMQGEIVKGVDLGGKATEAMPSFPSVKYAIDPRALQQ